MKWSSLPRWDGLYNLIPNMENFREKIRNMRLRGRQAQSHTQLYIISHVFIGEIESQMCLSQQYLYS